MTYVGDKITIIYLISKYGKPMTVEKLMKKINGMPTYFNFGQIQNIIDILDDLIQDDLVKIEGGRIWLNLKK